jgi:hypothetical protein
LRPCCPPNSQRVVPREAMPAPCTPVGASFAPRTVPHWHTRHSSMSVSKDTRSPCKGGEQHHVGCVCTWSGFPATPTRPRLGVKHESNACDSRRLMCKAHALMYYTVTEAGSDAPGETRPLRCGLQTRIEHPQWMQKRIPSVREGLGRQPAAWQRTPSWAGFSEGQLDAGPAAARGHLLLPPPVCKAKLL